MKIALIFLSSLAAVLLIFTYFAVFGGMPGTYGINPLPTSTKISTSTTFVVLPGMSSSTQGSDGSTGGPSSSGSGSSTSFYGRAFTTPPITWSDSGANFSIVAASLQDDQLSFTLNVQIGASPTCAPLNIRLVADETGKLQVPDDTSFNFPDSGNCNGGPNSFYKNQSVTFTVNTSNFPLLFTTGGSANTFFEVATTSQNGIQIDLPSTSG
jgi:hypothetical protein